MTVFFFIFEGKKICFSSCSIFYCLIHFYLVLTYQPLLPGSPNLPSRLYIIPCLSTFRSLSLFCLSHLCLSTYPFNPFSPSFCQPPSYLPFEAHFSICSLTFPLPLAFFPLPSYFQLCIWLLQGGNLYLLPLFPPSSIPTILTITPSISVGPLTLSPLPPCMCIILPAALYFITAYHLNLSPIHLFPSQPSISSFSIPLFPLTSSFDLPSLLVHSFP